MIAPADQKVRPLLQLSAEPGRILRGTLIDFPGQLL